MDYNSSKPNQKLVENKTQKNLNKKKFSKKIKDFQNIKDNDGDNYVYLASLDKRIYSIEALRMSDKNEMKKGIIMALANEPASQAFIEAIITLRKNICYRYKIEGSDDYVDVVVPYSELKSVLSRFGKKM